MSDIPRNTPQERAGAKEKRPKMRTWRHENWKTSTSEHFTWRRKKVSQFRAVVSDCGGGRAEMANEQTGREGEGGGETGAVVFVDCYFKTSQPRDLEVKWNCQKKTFSQCGLIARGDGGSWLSRQRTKPVAFLRWRIFFHLLAPRSCCFCTTAQLSSIQTDQQR